MEQDVRNAESSNAGSTNQNADESSSTAAGSTNQRFASNPPSVRSTPSPVPSNISSCGTGSKIKRARSILTASERSEESESNSEIDYSHGNDSNLDTEGEGTSELGVSDEIELIFRPHPTEMTGENHLIKALKENSVRYLKTTANASGMTNETNSNCVCVWISSNVCAFISFQLNTSANIWLCGLHWILILNYQPPSDYKTFVFISHRSQHNF